MKKFWILVSITLCVSVAFAKDGVTPKLEPKADIVKKLKDLKPNEACLLPIPSVLGQISDTTIDGINRTNEAGPEGRDFSIKMVWMPDRERAFFCGANHGAPHRLNDAWEYDLASNTWVLLHDPDFNDSRVWQNSPENIAKAKSGVTLKDGFMQTKAGNPIHVAHTWWGLTYEPNLKKIFWYCVWPGRNGKADILGFKKEDLYEGPLLWTFEPEKKKWAPYKTEKPWGRPYGPGFSLEYIPDLKAMALQYDAKSDILDAVSGKWRFSNPKDSAAITIETIVYYDSKRKILVAHRGDQPSKEDPTKMWNGRDLLKYRTWIAKLDGQGVGPWELVYEGFDAPIGHDARSTMYYDPKSGDGLCFVHTNREMWSFNPDAKKWTKLEPTGDKIDTSIRTGNYTSYFDPKFNVYVVSAQRGWVWCYRYK